jgi:hypothetical protein
MCIYLHAEFVSRPTTFTWGGGDLSPILSVLIFCSFETVPWSRGPHLLDWLSAIHRHSPTSDYMLPSPSFLFLPRLSCGTRVFLWLPM